MNKEEGLRYSLGETAVKSIYSVRGANLGLIANFNQLNKL